MKNIFVILSAILFLLSCNKPNNPDVAGNGTQTGNAVVTGHLYKASAPAIGAKVYFVKVNYNPHTGALEKAYATSDTVTTDSTGKYGTNDLDTGTYNVFGTDTDGTLSLVDSVHITGDTQAVPADTLKQPGSLAGTLKMYFTDSPGSVFIIMFGTGTVVLPQLTGGFSIANLAEGSYSVRFLSTLDRYLPLDTTFKITAGTPLTLPDSIVLPLKIPTPTGFKVAYDTLKQIVTLSWDKMDTTHVKGYNVYRQHVDSAEVKLNTQPLTSPLWVDSAGIEDQTYIYSVVAVDFENHEGIRTVKDSVKIVSAFAYQGILGAYGTGVGQYNNPVAVCVSKDRIFVADIASNGNDGKVIIYDTSGIFIKEIKPFYRPINFGVGADSGLYIMGADNTITYVNPSDSITVSFGGKGSSPGLFDQSGLWSMAISSQGDLYITDPRNNRIQILDSMGNYKREFLCNHPMGIAFIDNDVVAVSFDDFGWGRIGILDTNGAIQKKWDGTGLLITTTANNIAAAYDANPFPSRVILFSKDGALLARFGHNGNDLAGFQYLRGIALDNLNRIYIADNYGKKIKMFKLPNGL